MNNSINMLDGSIIKGLVRFSLPLIFSSVLQLLFNAADIIVIGRFGSSNSLAAVGAVSVIWSLCALVFMHLGSGATVLAGKNIGAGKKAAVNDVVHVATALALLLGLAVTAAMWHAIPYILRALQTPTEVFGLSLTYMYWLIPGIPAIALYNFGAGILRAKGDTKRPLYFLIVSGAANVIMNLIFVIPLKMDVAGVGLATTISQYISTFLIYGCLALEKDEFKLEVKKIKLKRDIAASILRVGIPGAIQCSLFSISNMVIQAAVNSFGPVVMAGNAAASNLENFTWVSMAAVSQAAMSFTSQNFGAGNFSRIKKTIIQGSLFSAAVGLVLGMGTYILARPLLFVYTTNDAAIEEGVVRLGCLCAPYCLCGIMDCLSTNLRGLGHAAVSALVVLLGACGTRILWIFTAFQTPRFHTTRWLLLTYPASWIITSIALALFLARAFRQERARFEPSA